MALMRTMELTGWGRYPRARCEVVCPERVADVAPPSATQMIARGQGRSYGDAAQTQGGLVMLTEGLDRAVEFDAETGILRAEAGMTLDQLLADCVPQGWFPPVTPGTKFVSLGGCLAADVHGKNHHRDGTFGAHVRELELVLADGSRRRCAPDVDAELFWATVGGMGLTGIMTEVVLQLIPVESAHVVVQHHRAPNLDASLELLSGPEFDAPYTVAWIDCLSKGSRLGRSVLMRGHHATRAELPLKVREPLRFKARGQRALPFDFPSWVLNPLTMTAFNLLYYWRQGARREPFITNYESFFYPLDAIGNWNRMYGKRGFLQYQCALPTATARTALRTLLEELARSRRASFLAVLKRFGPEGRGLLSFPIEGYTLALDLPLSDTAGLFTFLDQLDEIVLKHGGRVYLAKDARMKAETFALMYARLPEWRRIKREVDPFNRFTSDLARRLGL